MIWQKVKKPVFCLAPMEGVTDTVFRRMVVKMGKPDVFFTEFVSVEGMASAGAGMVTQRLEFEPEEQPVVAQLWGLKPENFLGAAQEVVKRGFAGVDLNFGCPDRSVVKMGACAAMVENDPGRVLEIIAATKEGVAGKIPVSVKTRIGFRKIATREWVELFLKSGIAALTVHGRTVKELSEVSAHWDEIGRVVEIRNEMKAQTLIIGNGDVESVEEGERKVKEFGVDGVMIGRGIFKNPWLFGRVDPASKSREERLALLVEHTKLYVSTWGEKKNFEELKKYFKIYIRDFAEASAWREKLMECHSLRDVERVAGELSSFI